MKMAVASGKGGVGKSMLASAMAMLFARGQKVVVVDCDVDAPNLHLWLGEDENWGEIEKISVSEKPVINFEKCDGCGKCIKTCAFGALSFFTPRGLKDFTSKVKLPILNPYFCEGCGACEIVCPTKAIQMKAVKNAEIKIKEVKLNGLSHFTKVSFPLISAQLYPGETGSGKIVEEIKARAEKFAYEIMILDSPAGTGCPVIAAVKDANFAVLVTEPTPSGVSDLKRVLTVVDYFQIPFGIVINKWDINPEISQKTEKEFRGKILDKISYDKRIFQAIANLKPILKTKLPVKKEIKIIFEKLKQKM